LISGKPVTQSLTKNLEPLTQAANRLKSFTPRYDCNEVLNFPLSMKSCLASFGRGAALKIRGRRG